jgi:hypothetical protein
MERQRKDAQTYARVVLGLTFEDKPKLTIPPPEETGDSPAVILSQYNIASMKKYVKTSTFVPLENSTAQEVEESPQEETVHDNNYFLINPNYEDHSESNCDTYDCCAYAFDYSPTADTGTLLLLRLRTSQQQQQQQNQQ